MELNKEQKKAAEHLDGPMLVLAGAGSGKTRVVTERVVKLIKKGILPTDILCVTFTNKASKVMKERILNYSNENVLTCTFHSLGARILRESIHELGYSRNFVIYDAGDSLKVIQSLISHLQLKNEKKVAKELQGKISNAKNELIDPKSSEILSSQDEKFKEIYPKYVQTLKQSNALDFDDLLYLTVKLLKENKLTREIYQNRWLFILIDEYQDTNYAQYLLSKILVDRHKNLFAVGDPDQSIYSWRGAKYQNIINFENNFPNAQVITLEHNYRSTNTILSAANHLITQNETRYDKKLFSTLGDGEKITLLFSGDENEEARKITNLLLDYTNKQNISLNNSAIFYRTNAQSRAFEDFLLKNQIPYIIYGGISFYQRREIKDIISYLRIIQTGTDMLSFSRTINTPKRGLGKAFLEKFLKIMRHFETDDFDSDFFDEDLNLIEILNKIIEDKNLEIKLSTKQRNSIIEYVKLINDLKKIEKQVSLQELIKNLISKINYFKYLEEDPQTSDDRKENVEELLAKASLFDLENKEYSLEKFLEEISLISTMDKKDETDVLKLMSLHNSKGLEFDLVFIAGLEEDILPHANSKNSLEELEEERRLFYVGMTRAKKHLIISSSQNRFMWGFSKPMLPSRFIKEIPTKYIKMQKNDQNTFRSKSFTPRQTNNIEDLENSNIFKNGTTVVHNTFGKGLVKKAYNTSMGQTYDVLFFDGNIIRSLAQKYAKLQKC